MPLVPGISEIKETLGCSRDGKTGTQPALGHTLANQVLERLGNIFKRTLLLRPMVW